MAQMQAEMDKEVDEEDEAGQNSLPPSPSASGSRTTSNGSNPSPRSRAVVPEGAMPSRNGVLSQHAAEFWFPECRNCPCCKGFKHGCACRSPVQDTCADPNCVDPEHAAAVRARPPSQPSTPSGELGPKSFSDPTQGRHLPPPRGAPSDEASVPCRFFNSPNGCRFGATCRHAHSGPGGGGDGGGGGAPYMQHQHHAPRGVPRAYSDGPMYPPNPGNPMMGQRGGGGWAPHMGGPSMGGPMGMGGMGGGGMHHGSAPQGGSREPCTFFQQGSCRYGATCRFAHGP